MKNGIEHRIRELREEVGLTQQQLADKLHFNVSTVTKWENGKKIPSYQSLKLLAKFFDVSADYLLEMDSFHPKFDE